MKFLRGFIFIGLFFSWGFDTLNHSYAMSPSVPDFQILCQKLKLSYPDGNTYEIYTKKNKAQISWFKSNQLIEQYVGELAHPQSDSVTNEFFQFLGPVVSFIFHSPNPDQDSFLRVIFINSTSEWMQGYLMTSFMAFENEELKEITLTNEELRCQFMKL